MCWSALPRAGVRDGFFTGGVQKRTRIRQKSFAQGGPACKGKRENLIVGLLPGQERVPCRTGKS